MNGDSWVRSNPRAVVSRSMVVRDATPTRDEMSTPPSMSERRAASRSLLKRVAASPSRILSALPPLTTPSVSIWATTALAMSVLSRT